MKVYNYISQEELNILNKNSNSSKYWQKTRKFISGVLMKDFKTLTCQQINWIDSVKAAIKNGQIK